MITRVNDELLIVRLSGILDSGAVHALAEELNKIETAGAYPKRLVFVAETLTISINSDDAMYYKSRRPEPQTAVQTAFCVFNDFQYGMARMFQAFLESEQHTIAIFRDIESAAQWLHVDIDLLRKQSL